MKYRKKPVVIEARQWTGGAEAATPVIQWILDNSGTARYIDSFEGLEVLPDKLVHALDTYGEVLAIDTLEGTFYAPPGWWVIKGLAGEFYACESEIFEKSYEPFPDDEIHTEFDAGGKIILESKSLTEFALDEVRNERFLQDVRWGEQNHPDGTGSEEFMRLADHYREECEKAFKEGRGTWAHIFLEEVYEALAEADPALLKYELTQATAVGTQWIEKLIQRTRDA